MRFGVWSCVVLAILLVADRSALAQVFDPTGLSPADLTVIQNILEYERAEVARRLPASGATLTLRGTRTSPRICRDFVIENGGTRQTGVGCRVGDQRWELAASADAIPQPPQAATPATPTASPEAVAAALATRPRQSAASRTAGSAPSGPPRAPLPERRPTDSGPNPMLLVDGPPLPVRRPGSTPASASSPAGRPPTSAGALNFAAPPATPRQAAFRLQPVADAPGAPDWTVPIPMRRPQRK